ncbi:MAG: aminoacyl-tRNA hydrolase [Proteobacteria bacterium]|nr:MAG: aminoacyl-tRNA hydrolase [Pseudomonadota bacterium]QKK11358.1 MAG: aminoacyl-tRNA hydrolase [Pseudomonadota bacterium]
MAIELIVGLGNPGSEYRDTRHNAGFWWLDDVVRLSDANMRPEARFHGETARASVHGHAVRLLKPTTYMNRSGQSVAALTGFYRIPLESILVVHDEIDLEPGIVRLKQGGGHGGHNGLRDIIAALGSKEFYRLRLGVGHPGHSDDVVDYVLRKPRSEEKQEIERAMDKALRWLPEIVAGQMQRAMTGLHTPD